MSLVNTRANARVPRGVDPAALAAGRRWRIRSLGRHGAASANSALCQGQPILGVRSDLDVGPTQGVAFGRWPRLSSGFRGRRTGWGSMGEAGEHTTQVLLQRMRTGDARARAALVARIEPLLRRFAQGRLPQVLRHEQDTADLVQLTWLKVLDKIDGIELSAPGDFFSYLRTVLLNALREALRKHGRSRVDVHADAESGLAELVAENVDLDDWLAYEQVIAALPAESRVLVLMRFEFGMSFTEIAAEFGETPDVIRMRVNRAVARIAQEGHGQPG